MATLRFAAGVVSRMLHNVAPHAQRRSYTFALRPFGAEIASALALRGFAVFDDAITASEASLFRSEIDLLADEGLLKSNATHLVSSSGSTVQLRKRGVFEAELHTLPAPLRARIPALTAVESDPSACALLNVLHPRLTLRDQAVKAQRSVGGGACFPLHVDSATAIDSRVVTALLYLNADWDCERHGGALRVYPFPRAHVDIAPMAGRLVLISGTNLLHRVLPASKTRYALTIWLSGTYRPQPEADVTAGDVADDDELIANALLSRKFRGLVARVALAEEWDTSLREAHAPAEAAAALNRHAADRATIKARLPRAVGGLVHSDGTRAAAVERRVRALLADPGDLLRLLRAYGDGTDGHWL